MQPARLVCGLRLTRVCYLLAALAGAFTTKGALPGLLTTPYLHPPLPLFCLLSDEQHRCLDCLEGGHTGHNRQDEKHT